MTRRPALWIACLSGLGVSAFLAPPGTPSAARAPFRHATQDTRETDAAGADACKVCHLQIFAAWEASHHGRTSRPLATPTGGADLAIGSSWVQVYLRKDASGLHRMVDEAFDVEHQAWLDIDDVLEAIAGPPMPGEVTTRNMRRRNKRSFEVDCSGCHVSGTRLRQDVEQGRIVGGWRAASIDCEACHGPAAEHVEAWKRLDDGEPLLDLESLDARAASSVCARCHGGSGVGSEFTPFLAEHWVTWPRVGPKEGKGVYAHGAASGQVYQADAFFRSACHLEGELSCTDCHSWHTDDLQHPEHVDAICTRCHETQANREHTHHAMNDEGGRCVSCHMPKLSTGLLAHQRDHRISSPLPSALEAPDACTACHADNDKAWATEHAKAWWGAPRERTLEAVRGVNLARTGDVPAARPLLEKALSHPHPFFRWAAAIWLRDPTSIADDALIEGRLVAVELASERPDGGELLRAALEDPSPVVRANAYVALERRGEPPIDPPVEELEIAAQISRIKAGLRVVLARAYLAQERVEPAIDLLEETVVFGQRAPDAWLVLAGAYVLAERDAAAQAAVRRWTRITTPPPHMRALVEKIARSGNATLERAVLTAVAEHAVAPELRSWARTRRGQIEAPPREK